VFVYALPACSKFVDRLEYSTCASLLAAPSGVVRGASLLLLLYLRPITARAVVARNQSQTCCCLHAKLQRQTCSLRRAPSYAPAQQSTPNRRQTAPASTYIQSIHRPCAEPRRQLAHALVILLHHPAHARALSCHPVVVGCQSLVVSLTVSPVLLLLPQFPPVSRNQAGAVADWASAIFLLVVNALSHTRAASEETPNILLASCRVDWRRSYHQCCIQRSTHTVLAAPQPKWDI
jgi:hypothetical protein